MATASFFMIYNKTRKESMVMKELTFKRTSIIAIALVVMCLMLTSVAGAAPVKKAAIATPSNGIIQNGHTVRGTYDQKATSLTNAEHYQMTLTFSNVDTNAYTFDGVETLVSPQSAGKLIASVSGSYDPIAKTITWTLDDTIQDTSTESPSLGEVDNGILGTSPKITGTGNYQGLFIGTFKLY
jgi:hypothetical protein